MITPDMNFDEYYEVLDKYMKIIEKRYKFGLIKKDKLSQYVDSIIGWRDNWRVD